MVAQLEDGWVVYRGILCQCEGAAECATRDGTAAGPASPVPISSSSSSSSIIPAPLSSPNASLRALESSPAAGRGGVIELLHNGGGGGGGANAIITAGHSHACQIVLVKTRPQAPFSPEQIAALKYETVLFERLQTAPPTGAEDHAAALTNQPRAAIITPHLRQLADGRLALILPDGGGMSLRRLMSTRLAQQHVSTTEPDNKDRVPQQPPHLLAAASLVRATGVASVPSTSPLVMTADTVANALRLTLALASKLQQLHRESLILKSLRPSQVLVNPATLHVEILSLTSASLAVKDKVEADFNPGLTSTDSWLYLAPEQSGKANRGIDARTDLYSLGAIMYELLTGRPPFQSSDTLELIHQHLARAPPAIIPRGSTAQTLPILTVASAIAQKLLHKQAEDRYQSTAGLIHDLTSVLAIVQKETESASSPADSTAALPSALATFQIGQLDLYSTFRLSQQLYGREDEVRSLIQAYQRICTNHMILSPKGVHAAPQSPSESNCHRRRFSTSSALSSDTSASSGWTSSSQTPDSTSRSGTDEKIAPQLFLISGHSGVGKTSLVDELHKHIVRQRGLFARSKFDLFKRDSSCLLQAFRQLIVQLTVTDPATWKARLLRALGANGQIICEVIPELTRLIGEQPPVPKLNTSESANRFSMVFLQFVSTLASPTSPLTLFIDDLQWADSGSLALLTLLLTQESAYLLVIGAYRNNEVDSAHLLTKLINEVQEQHPERVTEVTPRPLATHHIVELLVDSFRCSKEAGLPFAQLLFTKTQGNPFFLTTMLRTFYDEHLLSFNFQTAQWQVELESMRLTAVADDVVSVLCGQMLGLSESSQQLLQYAACLGNTFNMHALAVTSQLQLTALIESSCELVRAGLLICTAHHHELVLLEEDIKQLGHPTFDHTSDATPLELSDSAVPSDTSSTSIVLLSSIVLTWCHDAVQTAAYRLIPASQLSSLHCTIAQQLIASYSEKECIQHAMTIAGHLNHSDGAQLWHQFLSQPLMLDRVIELEIVAGRQAKAANAYESAIGFFSACLGLVLRKDVESKEQGGAAPTEDLPLPEQSPTGVADEAATRARFLSLPSSCWSSAYATCLALYQELAASLFLFAEYRQAAACIEYMLEHITDIHDRANLFELCVQSVSQFDMTRALSFGLASLKELGVEPMPAMTPELQTWIEAFPDVEDEATFTQHPIHSMPRMTNPLDVHAMVLCAALTPVLFYLNSPRFYNVALTMIELTRLRGTAPASAFAFVLYSLCIWGTHKQYALHYALGQAAKHLIESFGASGRSMQSRINNCLYGPNLPWHIPFRDVTNGLVHAFEECLQQNDMEWGKKSERCRAQHGAQARESNSLGLYVNQSIVLQNMKLQRALPRQRNFAKLLVKLKMEVAAQYSGVWLDFNEALAAHPKPARVGGLFDTVPMLTLAAGISQGMLHFYGRRIAPALELFEQAAAGIAAVSGLPLNIPYLFYRVLTLLASCPIATFIIGTHGVEVHLPVGYDAALVMRRLADADELIKLAVLWNGRAPCNWLHKLQLMQAERNRVAMFSHLALSHLFLPTIALYEKSAENAAQSLFPLEEALTLELTARFLFACDRHSMGDSYLKRSFAAYESFGAMMKLHQLKNEYPLASLETAATNPTAPVTLPTASALTTVPSSSDGSTVAPTPPPPAPVTDLRAANSFDVISVLKATASFSTEKDQKRLLKRLMRIVLETGGATRGALVLEDANHDWAVELSASVDAEDTAKDDSKDESEFDAATKLDPSTSLSAASPLSCDSSESGSLETSNSTIDSMWSSGPRTHLRPGLTSVSSALPLSVFQSVLGSVETVLLSDPHTGFSAFAADPYFETHSPRALLCMPVLKAGRVFGVLYLENDFHAEAFTSSHIQLLQLLCGQASLSIDNARLYSELSLHNARLEEVVQQRTSELEVRNVQLLTAKEEAERATKIKADFLSNMSHEIRTPMNAVLGVGRLLSETDLSLEQQQYVSMINNSGHLLLTIINDILDYSKIEAGQLTLTPLSNNIVDVVETAVMLCYDMASTKGLSLTWDVDPLLPANLHIDATRLQQVLLNLLSNAIKFTRQGSVSLKVTGRRVDSSSTVGSSASVSESLATPRRGSRGLLTVRSSPSISQQRSITINSAHKPPHLPSPAPQDHSSSQYRLEFSVTDSGIGISAQQLSTLFRSFSQVQHVSGEYGGTGLGLVISKRLVEAMSGEFSVDSRPGFGSTFSFFIGADAGQSSMGSAPSTRPTSNDSSPAPPQSRRLGDAAKELHPVTMESPSGQLHGLLAADLRLLRSARVIYIGERDAAASGHVRLLEHGYGCQVHVCAQVSDAAEHIRAHWLPSTEPAAAAAGLVLTTCDAIIVDLDTPGVTEEALREHITPLMHVRTLLTYSKNVSPTASTILDSSASASASPPTPFTPLLPLLVADQTAPLSPTSPDRSELPSSLLLISPSTLSRSMRGPNASLTRAIRRPWKQRLFLRELVTLLASTATGITDSPSIARSHLIAAAGDTIMTDVCVDGVNPHLPSASARSASASQLHLLHQAAAASSVHARTGFDASVKPRIRAIASRYPMRILLAEDNLINQKLMVMMMRKLGYDVSVAANGREVLDALEREAKKGREHEFECILMDASMDVMDGIECTRVIRAQQLPHRLRPFIIAQTANVTEEYQRLCLTTGMDAFCSKPIHVEALTKCLREAHAAHHPVRASAAHT